MEMTYIVPKQIELMADKEGDAPQMVPTKMSGTIVYDQPLYAERLKLATSLQFEVKDGVARKREMMDIIQESVRVLSERIKTVAIKKDNGHAINDLEMLGADRMGSAVINGLMGVIVHGVDLGES